MDQETYNNLEGFENASGPSTTPSPNTAQPSGTNSYPKQFAPSTFSRTTDNSVVTTATAAPIEWVPYPPTSGCKLSRAQ